MKLHVAFIISVYRSICILPPPPISHTHIQQVTFNSHEHMAAGRAANNARPPGPPVPPAPGLGGAACADGPGAQQRRGRRQRTAALCAARGQRRQRATSATDSVDTAAVVGTLGHLVPHSLSSCQHRYTVMAAVHVASCLSRRHSATNRRSHRVHANGARAAAARRAAVTLL